MCTFYVKIDQLKYLAHSPIHAHANVKDSCGNKQMLVLFQLWVLWEFIIFSFTHTEPLTAGCHIETPRHNQQKNLLIYWILCQCYRVGVWDLLYVWTWDSGRAPDRDVFFFYSSLVVQIVGAVDWDQNCWQFLSSHYLPSSFVLYYPITILLCFKHAIKFWILAAKN